MVADFCLLWYIVWVRFRLNPCFNGRWLRTPLVLPIMVHCLGCLNPCFNGRWLRTTLATRGWTPRVSGLNPCFNGRWLRTIVDSWLVRQHERVLILVLMEDGCGQNVAATAAASANGLNPCFNGRWLRTYGLEMYFKGTSSLNPCFNGRWLRTTGAITILITALTVLILVLMEDGCGHSIH